MDGKVMLAAITGAIGGVIAGILYAPDKGSNTRNKISARGDEYLKDIKSNVEEIRKTLVENVLIVKEKTIHNGEKAKKKKEEIINYEKLTKTELDDLARENNIKGYYKMTKAELIKALKSMEE